MTAETVQRVWQELARQRDAGRRPEVTSILDAFDTVGEPVDPETLWALLTRARVDFAEGVCPPSISSFVADLLKPEQHDDILDPWSGLGFLLGPVAVVVGARRAVGLHPRPEIVEAASRLLPADATVEFRTHDLRQGAPADLGQFDVVVGVPPFRGGRAELDLGGQHLHDEGGLVAFARALLHLREGGVAVLVTTPRVFFRRPRSFLPALEVLGIFPDACFTAPAGAWRPLTAVETVVLVLRRAPKPPDLFVGEALPAGKARTALLKGYRDRKPGKTPLQGALVDAATYRDLRQVTAQHEVVRRTSRLTAPQVRLGDLATITRWAGSDGAEVDGPSTLYMSLIDGTRCRASSEGLPERSRDWIRIEVDEQKADSRVFLGFLDSELGRLIRASRSTGTTIRRMNLAKLKALPLWLPPPAEQAVIVAADQRIRLLQEELLGLRRDLWARLDHGAKVAERVEQVNRRDGFKDWLATLPFPLASILWTYHTLEGRPLARYQQLDYFFEGLAQFVAVWVMSAARASGMLPELWASASAALAREHLSIRRSTFGTWVAIHESFAKALRAPMNNKDEVAAWRAWTACESERLLPALVSKPLVTLLKTANKARNDWRGHGGSYGNSEAERREGMLLELLVSFREIVGNDWATYPLLLPETSRFRDGMLHYTARRVMGPLVPFERVKLQVRENLTDEALYLSSLQSGHAMRLEPFVRLSSPKTKEPVACFFFNRLEPGDDVRYVSYHTEDRPPLVEPFPDVVVAIDSLMALA